MTVQELIDKLAKFSPDMPILMSQDAEGNNYRPFFEAVEGRQEFEDYYSVLANPDDWIDLPANEWRPVVVFFPED